MLGPSWLEDPCTLLVACGYGEKGLKNKNTDVYVIWQEPNPIGCSFLIDLSLKSMLDAFAGGA